MVTGKNALKHTVLTSNSDTSCVTWLKLSSLLSFNVSPSDTQSLQGLNPEPCTELPSPPDHSLGKDLTKWLIAQAGCELNNFPASSSLTAGITGLCHLAQLTSISSIKRSITLSFQDFCEDQ